MLPSKVVLPVNGPMSQSLESVSKSGISGPVTRGWGRQVLGRLAMEVGFAITKCRVVF